MTCESGKPASATVGDPHRDLPGVLHDVSNALTVLLGWIGEARTAAASAETVAYALAIVEQRARMARDLARHAIGGPRVDEQLAAGEIVRDVVDALAVEASRAGVTMIVTGGNATARVGGALDLSQVLTNVLMNALAHAPQGSEVTIEITADDEQVSLVVADQGPGVPSSLRESIFRGESARPGGTGVGLRHSLALARAASGDVALLPDTVGGARFRIRWPRVDVVPRPPLSAARVPDLVGLRVLVVEDDSAVTQLLETALKGRGAEVTMASTGAELAAAMAGAPYHAALVDLSPIASDTEGALALLRHRSPGIDLVLITGSADRLPETVTASEMKLVRKPFEVAEVLAALTKKA